MEAVRWREKREALSKEVTFKQTDKLLELGRRAENSTPEARKESKPFKVSMNRTH